MVDHDWCPPKDLLGAMECIHDWLAMRNEARRLPSDENDRVLIVLCGSAVIDTVASAARLFHELRGRCTVLVTGGVGHSTPYLLSKVGQDPRYQHCTVLQRNVMHNPDDPRGALPSEARIFASILSEVYSVPMSSILVEDRSTNCGDNVTRSLAFIEEWITTTDVARDEAPGGGRAVHWIVVLQDPTMLRRSFVGFNDALHTLMSRLQAGRAQVDRIKMSALGIPFEAYCPIIGTALGISWGRYVSLLCGEIPRLRDDAQGYGPKGRAFIPHVDIPHDVEAAFRTLLSSHPAGFATR